MNMRSPALVPSGKDGGETYQAVGIGGLPAAGENVHW